VITNARSIVVTGKKAEQKLYRHHSGFPGGLKEITYKTMMENKPEEVRSLVSRLLLSY
jgi:large subunit ribosomal protein L13